MTNNHGGLSLQVKIGDSVILNVDGKEIRITLYETTRAGARLRFKADSDVKIHRSNQKPKELDS